jgi:hypothetical protein
MAVTALAAQRQIKQVTLAVDETEENFTTEYKWLGRDGDTVFGGTLTSTDPIEGWSAEAVHNALVATINAAEAPEPEE